MLKRFVFMTGAAQYRIHAQNRQQAIEQAYAELNPTLDARAVIQATMRDEDEVLKIDHSDPAPEAFRAKPSAPGRAQNNVVSMSAKSLR